ncbi:hypothetical protein [Janthinobacterium agaricidamnosum]|uniref:Uncharacterized protein n=1 Tax=Janthinobacterium agaricidamnosum NBRC 102515 = DSM 9628 TaxID=1349767 RepID=W0V4W6_9BURK|nr:hypothetical protein [Janthinobacterium agaricidamnosum]CDG82640.1 hypothetical protein GJA_2005 [Janthinobacterium agaricidamnosum NBRC 102515 = DSM 9628]
MSKLNITLPSSAQCRCLLPDGRLLTVTATRRPRAGRADVKCVAAGAPALCERMQEVVRLARHTESRFDSRDQVVLSVDALPRDDQRDWELAAVLADRMVRGEYRAARPLVYAQGWSDAWHLGQVSGAPDAASTALRARLSQDGVFFAVLGGDSGPAPAGDYLCLSHLGGLSGHADPSAGVSSARAWFPLHSGGVNDSLGWVEVSVHPLEAAAADEEDTIAVPGLDASGQLAVRQALAGARHFDGRGLGRWRSVVRFGPGRFQGNSYELALVMADRLARGRDFVPRGRLIASGCSSAWHAGRVDSVEGRAPKRQLILNQAVAGDRVLLPKAWLEEGAEAAAFGAALKEKGASVGWITHIGLI